MILILLPEPAYPGVSIDRLDDVDLPVPRPLVSIARAQHPDGGPGALVTCHMSHVTCHMSHVTCHMSHVISEQRHSRETYLEVSAIDFSRKGGSDLDIASHLDVRGLSSGPDLTSHVT